MADWKAFELPTDPIVVVADAVSTMLSTFRDLLNLVLDALNLVKVFLIDLGNPLKALIKVLVELIIKILNDLNLSANAFFLPIIPGVGVPNISDIKGGIDNFNMLFSQSLYDTADDQRPQFSNDASVGAFFVVMDSGNGAEILELAIKFLTAIGQSVHTVCPPPMNVRAGFSNEFTQARLSLLDILGQDTYPTSVFLSWNPAIQSGGSLIDSFVPPNWRIEKSKLKDGVPFTVPGFVYNAQGEKITIDVPVKDAATGSPMSIFEFVADLPAKEAALGYLTNLYVYEDKTIQPGETWYYRVRGTIGDPPVEYKPSDVSEGIYRSPQGLLGVPSPATEVFLPKKIEGVEGNPINALASTLYAALILGFHVPYETSPAFIGQGSLYDSYPWLYRYLDSSRPTRGWYASRITYAGVLSQMMGTKLCRSKDLFQGFWDAYDANKTAVIQTLDFGGLPVSCPYWSIGVAGSGVDINACRTGVYAVIQSLIGAMATTGAPPNWISTFPAFNIIPAQVFGLLRKVEAEAKGLLSAFDGIVADILSFIALLEARIDALMQLIDFIDSIIKILKNFKFPNTYMLYVPIEGGGIPGLLSRYLEAGGDEKPVPSPGNYTAGTVFAFGGAGPGEALGAFFKMLSGG